MSRFDHLLQFSPLYQIRVWGGRRLETMLGRRLPDAQPYGESWELVDREREQSVVRSGPLAGTTLHELWTDDRREVFGARFDASPWPRFPVLIKILDCSDVLSIQVHPPPAVAASLGGESKTEMWYVLDADPGAAIYAGLRQGVTAADFEHAIQHGTVAECVHAMAAREGDSLFVPSGRLHALGRGLLVFEIQENSDTTYRVFDWNRLGLDGKPRELHVRQSMQCIDFTDVEPALAHHDGVLAECDRFRVTRARTGSRHAAGQFRLILPIRPTTWAGTTLGPGDLTLCPAALDLPDPIGEWLEIEM